VSPEIIIGTVGISTLGVTALVVGLLLVRAGARPWEQFATERGLRVRAEADRDAARAEAEKWATLCVEKDAKIRDDDQIIEDLLARLKPAPGAGTDGLRSAVEADDARRAGAADRDPGSDAPVPRVTEAATFPRDPIVPR
jgi:hypothetical protein